MSAHRWGVALACGKGSRAFSCRSCLPDNPYRMQVQPPAPARSPSPRSPTSLPPPAALVAATSTASARCRHLCPLLAARRRHRRRRGFRRSRWFAGIVRCRRQSTVLRDCSAIVNTGTDDAFPSSCRASLRESVVQLLAAQAPASVEQVASSAIWVCGCVGGWEDGCACEKVWMEGVGSGVQCLRVHRKS
jgi:hypothetical protein